MARKTRVAAIVIAASIAAFTSLYSFYPVSAHENMTYTRY